MSDLEECANRKTLTNTKFSGQVIIREQGGQTDLIHSESQSESTKTFLCQVLATIAPHRHMCNTLHLGDNTCPVALFKKGEATEDDVEEFLFPNK